MLSKNSNTMNIFLNIIVNIARLILSLTFIFSGFVKAVDPLGTQYKLQDYATAVGLDGIFPDWMFLCASIGLSLVEIMIGVLLLFAISRRITSKLALLFMAFMTAITVWIYFDNPVEDCGCFGDAIILTNGQTLMKNIVLITLSIIVAVWPKRMPRMISLNNQWIVFHYSILFIIAVSLYCVYYIPIFDFRPYKIGANIPEGMEIPEDAEQPEFETTFIMEKNGEQKEFTVDNYPDSTWTFVDSKTVQTKAGYEPPIHDFFLTNVTDGEDITDQVLSDPGYTFLLISHYLDGADDTNFGQINTLYDYAKQNKIPFYCVTSSDEKSISRWVNITGAEYPFCNADGLMLKTVVRSNPGLILLKNGTVVGKWSSNDLPSVSSDFKDPVKQFDQIENPSKIQKLKWVILLLYYVLPLFLLVIADRTWAWSRWLKRRKKESKD